jgi:hypothetical protein
MKRLMVLTPWHGDGQNAAFCPLVAARYPHHSCSDLTAQPAANLPPIPNLLAVEMVVDDATALLIDADADLTVLESEDA